VTLIKKPSDGIKVKKGLPGPWIGETLNKNLKNERASYGSSREPRFAKGEDTTLRK